MLCQLPGVSIPSCSHAIHLQVKWWPAQQGGKAWHWRPFGISLRGSRSLYSISILNNEVFGQYSGYLNFLHPQIKDFGQWESHSHHIQPGVSNPLRPDHCPRIDPSLSAEHSEQLLLVTRRLAQQISGLVPPRPRGPVTNKPDGPGPERESKRVRLLSILQVRG